MPDVMLFLKIIFDRMVKGESEASQSIRSVSNMLLALTYDRNNAINQT